MGFLRSLFGSKESPPIPLRDTLFGDLCFEKWPQSNADSFPWTAFASARQELAEANSSSAVALWREVLSHPHLESRHHLQAWHFLRQQGHRPPPASAKQVLGVVVE